jgi:hypothetical protein
LFLDAINSISDISVTFDTVTVTNNAAGQYDFGLLTSAF